MPVFAAITAVAGFLTSLGAGAISMATFGTIAATSVSAGIAVAVGGALVGAAIGATVAAVKGESILKGALKGGLIGAAVGSALGAGAKMIAAKQLAASTATTATTEGVKAAGTEVAKKATTDVIAQQAAPGVFDASSGALESVFEVGGKEVVKQTVKEGAKEGLLAGMSASDKAFLIGGGLQGAGALLTKGPPDPFDATSQVAERYTPRFDIPTPDFSFFDNIANNDFQEYVIQNPTDSNLYQTSKNAYQQIMNPYGKGQQPAGNAPAGNAPATPTGSILGDQGGQQ